MTRNTVIQLGMGALLVMLMSGAAMLVSPIQQQRDELQLGLTSEQLGEMPPGVVLATTAGGPFRGFAVLSLWDRATRLKEEGRYHEANQLAEWITALQPSFPMVWQFQAWNMAYNISVETHTPDDRWYWVMRGVDLIRNKGLKFCPREPKLYHELGWYFLHKMGGNTDDMHWTYKRRLALKWEEILGPPPGTMTSKEHLERFQRIVDAPETLEALYEQQPGTRELVDDLRAIEKTIDEELLREIGRIQMSAQSLALSVAAKTFDFAEAGYDAALLKLLEAHEAEEKKAALEALLNFIRKDVLKKNYNMDPAIMFRLMKKDPDDPRNTGYGPIDWRHPGAHALYWSKRAVDIAKASRHPDRKNILSFTRQVEHSLQLLAQFGSIDLDPHSRVGIGLRYGPNPDFFEAYSVALNQARIELEAVDKVEKFTSLHAGHQNFLLYAMEYYWLAGNDDKAREYYARVRELYGDQPHNRNRFQQDLDTLVWNRVRENWGGLNDLARFCETLLVRGFGALAEGDLRTYERARALVREADRQYREKKGETAMAERGRMLLGDLNVFEQQLFVQWMRSPRVNIYDRVRTWRHAPDRLRLYAYDRIIGILQQQSAAFGIDPAKAFPAPEGLAEYRDEARREPDEAGPAR